MKVKSRIRLCAIICLAIYGADMHKLLLTVFAFLAGKPLALMDYGRLADVSLAILTASLALAVFLFTNFKLRSLINVPLALMFFLGILMTLSLLQSSDEISMEHYYRFLGGNLLLFIGALLCCKSIADVRLIFNIWVFNSIILAVISIYLFQIGLTWSSGRSTLFPGTGIRTGYFCALSIIYLVSDIFFRTKRERMYYRFGLISILFAGVLLSGSKASMLLLLASLAALFILKLSMTKKIHVLSSLSIFAIIFLSVAVIIKSIVGLEMSGGEVGYLGDTLKFDSYLHAGHERIVLSKDYIRLGMKSSLIGHGISAAYSLDLRTHSVTTALFIQVGLIGLLAYLFFLLAVIFRGLKVMTKLVRMRYRNYDIPLFVAAFVGVIFLALKAEVTGDVPANRELWMFAGVFMALSNIVRLTEVTMFASFHLLPSHNT